LELEKGWDVSERNVKGREKPTDMGQKGSLTD